VSDAVAASGEGAGCTRVLALILTDVRSLGGADVTQAPLPDNVWTPLYHASLLTGASRKAIRNMLSRYPERFDPPSYRPVFDLGGQPTKGRWAFRVLSPRDVATLRTIYRVVSRPK